MNETYASRLLLHRPAGARGLAPRTESLTNASASLLRLVAENNGEFPQFFGGKVFHSGF